jgi:predicted RNase H-like nuclease (RuvC/YqgF family)
MKKSILILAVTVFTAGAFFFGCRSSATKLEDAKNNVLNSNNDAEQAQNELDKARQDSSAEYQKFKKESDDNFNAHVQSLADFRERIETKKAENKAEYEKKIFELDRQNSDLKKKLDDFKLESKDQWISFKTQFNTDMDRLNKAFTDLTVK